MSPHFIRKNLKQKGLKITPQRVAIYEAVLKLNNHPNAEKVIDYNEKMNNLKEFAQSNK